ncbi:MAG: hypothetical protein KF718_06245 [Polyangiaceae bacterium]|nr:hypothetical protein [Polyangiaceae bacterium]
MALHDLVETIESKDWAQGVPIVFDRAMGSAGAVARLCKSELRFLTAVRRSEIHSYTEELPSKTLTDLGGSEDEVERRRLIAEAGARISAAGMHKVDEQLYVLDLASPHAAFAWCRTPLSPTSTPTSSKGVRCGSAVPAPIGPSSRTRPSRPNRRSPNTSGSPGPA